MNGYDLSVLSLGAGVQSTAMLHMAIDEGWQLDVAIFADPGWEPRRVHRNVARCRELAAQHGLPFFVVSNGSIREDTLADRRSVSLPFFTRDATGKGGRLQRQCTYEYKIVPIRRKVRELLQAQRGNRGVRGVKVAMFIGYTIDEASRAKPSDVQYVEHRYPLIDRGWTRPDCDRYLKGRGWVDVPKSACIGCPFRNGATWDELDPDEVEDAIAFDEAIRARGRMSNCELTTTPYLHRDRRPLRDILADQAAAQTLFEAA